MQEISLIIPGRNTKTSIVACLEAASALLSKGLLKEIIYVDDGSADASPEMVRKYPLQYLSSKGTGISAARNTGLKEAKAELLWFIDADCIVEESSLKKLLPALHDKTVVAVGGGYLNLNDNSHLANLIQEEFEFRYSKMDGDSGYLTGCNLLFRKSILEDLGGFDETLGATEDGDLSFRVLARGYKLKFVADSRVRHYHPRSLISYLKKQIAHGYWVTLVAFKHRGKIRGNTYSSSYEHAQLILVLLFYLCLLPSLFSEQIATFLLALSLCLLGLQIPIAISLYSRSKRLASLSYIPFSFIRLFARGFGMLKALIALVLRRPLSGIHFGG